MKLSQFKFKLPEDKDVYKRQDNDIHGVFAVVEVGNHWHDSADLTFLSY